MAMPSSSAITGPTMRLITYYQNKRHIFGDLKIEVFDEAGKLLGTVRPASAGASRASWSMRPAAAQGSIGGEQGER